MRANYRSKLGKGLVVFGLVWSLQGCDQGSQNSVAGSPEGFPRHAARNVIVKSDGYRTYYVEDNSDFASTEDYRRRIEHEVNRYQWQELENERQIANQFPDNPRERLYFVEDTSLLDAPYEWGNEEFWDAEESIAMASRQRRPHPRSPGYHRPPPCRGHHCHQPHFHHGHRPIPHRPLPHRRFDCTSRVGYHRIPNYCRNSWRHVYPYTPIYRQPRTDWRFHPTFFWNNSFIYYQPVITWRTSGWFFFIYSIWW